MGRRAVPFASFIHFGPGCWEWMGCKSKDGYGHYVNPETKKMTKAHRYAYEISYGPIPEGMQICHSCDNPACVRRDHLFAGTPKDNQEDCVSKGRHRNQKKTHCNNGHEFDEANTYDRRDGSRGCKKCRAAKQLAYYRRTKKPGALETPPVSY